MHLISAISLISLFVASCAAQSLSTVVSGLGDKSMKILHQIARLIIYIHFSAMDRNHLPTYKLFLGECEGCKMQGMQCSETGTSTISAVPCCPGNVCENGFCVISKWSKRSKRPTYRNIFSSKSKPSCKLCSKLETATCPGSEALVSDKYVQRYPSF